MTRRHRKRTLRICVGFIVRSTSGVYDLPTNQVTLVVWTNLTVLLDQSPTANALMLKVLDQIYVVSPIPASPAPTAAQVE